MLMKKDQCTILSKIWTYICIAIAVICLCLILSGIFIFVGTRIYIAGLATRLPPGICPFRKTTDREWMKKYRKEKMKHKEGSYYNSYYESYPPEKSYDNNPKTCYQAHSDDRAPWVMYIFPIDFLITNVTIYPPVEKYGIDPFRDIQVRVGNHREDGKGKHDMLLNNNLCDERVGPLPTETPTEFVCPKYLVGKYVVVQQIVPCDPCSSDVRFTICEVEIDGYPIVMEEEKKPNN